MNKRNSNLELLIILAIIFIVSFHAFDHGVLHIIDLEKEQFSVIVVPEWVSFKQIIVSVFPLHFGSSWFISYYIVFSLFIPFFERQLNQAKNKNVALLFPLKKENHTIVPEKIA